MSRKHKHNAHIRARILEMAGPIFIREGFDGASIDTLMAASGLTRGAFYAHFTSKADLFLGVLQADDLLMRLLRNRSTATPDALTLGMIYIFDTLLDPDNFSVVKANWGLPAWARDAKLAGPAARDAYESRYAALQTEMCRAQPPADHAALRSVLSLACGAVSAATLCEREANRHEILRDASGSARALMLAVCNQAAAGSARASLDVSRSIPTRHCPGRGSGSGRSAQVRLH